MRDTIGDGSVSDLRHALAPGGTCIVTGFTTTGRLVQIGLRGGKRIRMIEAHATAGDLELLAKLIAAGELRPMDRPALCVQRAARSDPVPREHGRARGKVVVGEVV